MSYTLISSQRSPFGRICRMLMIQNKIGFDFRVLNLVDSKEDAAALARETPINKVPLLVINGEQKIFDSRVIVNYLTKKHGLRELTIDEENIVSAIYSIIDTTVILFLMKRDGYDINATNEYLARLKERIPRNLEYIKSWVLGLNAQKAGDWNYASMSLYSYVYWATARVFEDFSAYPHLARFLEDFKNAPGVQETTFLS